MLQWYGHLRVLGIPIPKTPVIWASPSHITLANWVRVRVTEDAHITRVLGMGMPKAWGCSYHRDTGGTYVIFRKECAPGILGWTNDKFN